MNIRSHAKPSPLTRLERRAVADSNDVRPGIWIIADTPGSRADAVQAAEASGARILGIASAAEAQGNPDIFETGLIVADVGDAGSGSAALLTALSMRAKDSYRPAIVVCSHAGIDAVVAHIDSDYAAILCDPTITDRIAAIGLSSVPVVTQFREFDTMADALRLQLLADEVQRIAKSLANVAERPRGAIETLSDGLIGYRAEPAPPQSAGQSRIRGDEIRAIIRLRRQRDRLFAGELFADPAWDMMLDLMAARIERLKVAVSSLCIAAAVPPTTALRWIRTLTELGIFVRVDDPTDGRRVFIDLSDAAAEAVLRFLGEAKRASVAVV